MKIKIIISVVLLCAAVLLCAGCGNTSAPADTTPQSGISSKTAQTAGAGTKTVKFDYDFTKMGQSVAYATLCEFMNDQPSFDGKTMKITGDYYAQPSEDGSTTYYYIILNDTTACCSAYIEFLAQNGAAYPEKASDPESGDIVQITASGKVGTYEEYGQKYYVLMVDTIY